MNDILQDSLSVGAMTIRFLLYPFIVYTLISLAVTLNAWKDKRVVALHISVSLLFMTLWAVNIAKLLGYIDYVPMINDYIFTPVLILVAIFSWRKVFQEERTRLLRSRSKTKECNHKATCSA
jgi:hypothetical protein